MWFQIWNSYRSVSFNFFAFLKYSIVWVFKSRLWTALQAFLQDEYFISYVSICVVPYYLTTASGSGGPRVGEAKLYLAVGTNYLRAHFTAFLIHFLFVFFFCLFVLFYFFCSHAKVLWPTVEHECQIFYSQTECNTCFFWQSLLTVRLHLG